MGAETGPREAREGDEERVDVMWGCRECAWVGYDNLDHFVYVGHIAFDRVTVTRPTS